MNKICICLCVILSLNQVANASVETNSSKAYMFLGFPAGAEYFQTLRLEEPDILADTLPSYAMWTAGEDGSNWKVSQERLNRFLLFWSKRIAMQTFSIEKAFQTQQKEEFFDQSEQLAKNFAIIGKEAYRELLVYSVMPQILASFLRMQESTFPQRRWISQEFLQHLIPQSWFSGEIGHGMKQMETYWRLLLLANAIISYCDMHNRLPDDLSEITGEQSDAWGCPILYLREGERWFLKSLGRDNVDKAKYDFDNRTPLVSTGINPILYSGISKDRIYLWTHQELKIGTVVTRLMDGRPYSIQDSQGETRFAVIGIQSEISE